MDANRLQTFIDQVESDPDLQEKLESGTSGLLTIADEAGYKITKTDARGFLSEMERITKEDKTHMPTLVVLIMFYINMLFPEIDYEQEVGSKT
tara:strand:+ start:253 stop:531 length:279 start_codon:yes stop_codon:yes gene_type:complete